MPYPYEEAPLDLIGTGRTGSTQTGRHKIASLDIIRHPQQPKFWLHLFREAAGQKFSKASVSFVFYRGDHREASEDAVKGGGRGERENSQLGGSSGVSCGYIVIRTVRLFSVAVQEILLWSLYSATSSLLGCYPLPPPFLSRFQYGCAVGPLARFARWHPC